MSTQRIVADQIFVILLTEEKFWEVFYMEPGAVNQG